MPLGLKRNIVQLVDHDLEWEGLAAKTIVLLWGILGTAAKDIQHIGSTAIRHIKAKPMIDIAVAIADFKEAEKLFAELEDNGFANRGWFLEEHRIFTVGEDMEPDDRITTHNIHIVKAGSSDWQDLIHFRDYLNAHPSAAKAYEALKIKLAREYPYDQGRKRYADGKSAFIQRTLQAAAEWRQQA